MTGPRGADGSLRANRFGSVSSQAAGVYHVHLPDQPGGDGTGASTYDRPPELGANGEETAKGKAADGSHRLVYELADGSHSSELSFAEGWRLAAVREPTLRLKTCRR